MTVDLLWKPERPVVHRAEWRTLVNLSQDGNEQRTTDLELPHHYMEVDLFFDSMLEVRRQHRKFFTSLSDTWRVPLWWEPYELQSEVLSGNNTWPLDMTYVDLAVGDGVYVEAPSGSPSQILTVGAVNPSDIQTSANASDDFPQGSSIYRLADNAKMIDPPQLVRGSSGLERVRVSLRYGQHAMGGAGATVSTFQHSADPAAFALLDRRPLSPAHYNFDAFIEPIDLGKVFSVSSGVDPSALFEQRRYPILARADLQWWEKFLDTIVGGREPFYAPTYLPDLVIDTQPSGPGWDTIKVKDEAADPSGSLDYAGSYFPHSSHKQLRLATDQGEQYKEVSTAVDNMDGTVTLTLASGLIANSVISEISFLERCRLMDVASFEHHGSWSTVAIGIKLVQRHPDE